MSAPIERNIVPNEFRDQYAGGIGPDPEVEAAKMGITTEQLKQKWAAQDEAWLNAQALKLR